MNKNKSFCCGILNFSDLKTALNNLLHWGRGIDEFENFSRVV